MEQVGNNYNQRNTTLEIEKKDENMRENSSLY